MERQTWVSEGRDELKGLAILWILFFHSLMQCVEPLATLQSIGYGGVDVFLFLMGFGLYRSLQRKADLRAYTSRRLWRILPAYLPMVLAWMLVMYPTYNLSTTEAIRGVCGNLFMVGYWISTPKVFNWYASALFFFVLIAPLIFAILSKSKRPTLTVLGLLAFSFGMGLANIGADTYMGISRLPIFVLGMAFAMERQPKIKKTVWKAAEMVSFVAGLAILLLCLSQYRELLNDYAMYWHPFVLITPPLCVFLAWLLHKASKHKRWFAPLRLIGQSSFEIYLLNIWMVELAKKYAVTGNGMWLLLCVANVLAGLGYHWVVNRATHKLHS